MLTYLIIDTWMCSDAVPILQSRTIVAYSFLNHLVYATCHT